MTKNNHTLHAAGFGTMLATSGGHNPYFKQGAAMLRKLSKRGFTLIELMIVVAIIGILAAIAIPNFIRFQARSKQGEAKSNLKSLFTAEKSFYQEKDKFSAYVDEVGFSPERGNRYIYRLDSNCGTSEVRTGVTATRNASGLDGCIQVDGLKYSGTVAPVYTKSSEDNAGVIRTCPDCDFLGTAAGDIDSETTGVDAWYVSSKSYIQVATNCGNADTASPSGLPYNTYNDVSCP